MSHSMQRDEKGREIDPDSGLPIGSIIQNHKGEYGVIGFRSVIRVTKEWVEKIKSEFGPGDCNVSQGHTQCSAIFAHDPGSDHVLYCRY